MQHENNMICYDNLLKLKYQLMGWACAADVRGYKGCCARADSNYL